MFHRKRRKEELHKDDTILANGIYLKKADMNSGRIVLNCFLRGCIVFLLAFGSIGSFLSSFAVSYNVMLVIFFFLLMAFYFSFLYATNRLLYRDIGYILFFIIFVGMIGIFRLYANSGLYSVVNQVLSYAQGFFGLSGVRQYDVSISNEYQTVAVLAIFIGMVMIILLNIWISSSMSVIWSVGLTFPLLLIPLYMKLTPDFSYSICLVAGYLAVLIFKANGHFMNGAKNISFHVKGVHKNRITYTQDAKSFGQVILYLLVFVFCLVIVVGNVFPAGRFEEQFKKDTLHEKTEDSIGNFLLLGFSGLYNRYASTGGLAEGKLGGISNVRADYQPDLIVDYAPYSADAIYLKGYTGGLYGDNEWSDIRSVTPIAGKYQGMTDKEFVTDLFMEESMKKEATKLMRESTMSGYGAMGKMTIRNVGANPAYLYYPYYTMLDDYSQYADAQFESQRGISMNQTVDYEYYPKQEPDRDLYDRMPEDMDLSEVNDIFLDVPQKNRTVISNECQKAGLRSDMTVGEIVETVQTYFDENIPYTLKPGSTPEGEDFINYFLTQNRKGYCAHFASAATLMFRQMGIPARYVEGYAFSFESALASDEKKDLKYEDYFKGYSTIGDSTVLEVEVTDAMAHAWVEIYVDGFGWRPVEVTPGSNETVDEDDFWSAFSQMLQNSQMNVGNTNQNGLGKLNLSEYKGLVYYVIAIIGILIVIAVLRIVIRKIKRYRKCHQKNAREALIAVYADLCDILRMCDMQFNACKSHKEQLIYMQERGYTDEEIVSLAKEMERISYSNEVITEGSCMHIRKILKQIRKNIWRQASFKKKMRWIRR